MRLAPAMSLQAWGIALLLMSPRMTGMAVAEQVAKVPRVEGLDLQAFDAEGQRTVRVRAARGYTNTKQWGFLKTALIPTLELEEGTVERHRADGTLEQRHVPRASLDWKRKILLSPSGKSIFRDQ